MESPNQFALAALIARLMDTAFVIPGTRIRFGLDALIGLFPGVGDAAGAVISSIILAQAARAGVPRIVLARMAGNVFLNSALGTVPILGDLFSVYFRSNVKNYELLKLHSGGRSLSTRGAWLFVVGLIITLFLAVALSIWGIIALIHELQSHR